MAISMLKIRRPLGRLIFNMGIAIPGKTVFLIETAPWFLKFNHVLHLSTEQIIILYISKISENGNFWLINSVKIPWYMYICIVSINRFAYRYNTQYARDFLKNEMYIYIYMHHIMWHIKRILCKLRYLKCKVTSCKLKKKMVFRASKSPQPK